MSETELPQDLKELVFTLQRFAGLFQVIQKSHFPIMDMQLVLESANLVRALHERIMQEALAHPSAELVPELVQEKLNRAAIAEQLNQVPEPKEESHV